MVQRMPWIQMSLCTTLFALSSSPLVSAVNHTIDDMDASIGYSSGWNVGNTCTTCWARPNDTSLIFQGTWHDTTRLSEADPVKSFRTTFRGTSVYVYGIIIDKAETRSFITDMNLTLTIDGVETASYVREAHASDGILYQQPVLVKHGLNDQLHTMEVSVNPDSVFLFDSITYTSTDDPSSNGSGLPSQIAAMAGVVVAAGAIIALCVLWFLCIRRKRRVRRQGGQGNMPTDSDAASQPFVQGVPSRTNITNSSNESSTSPGDDDIHLPRPYDLPPPDAGTSRIGRGPTSKQAFMRDQKQKYGPNGSDNPSATRVTTTTYLSGSSEPQDRANVRTRSVEDPRLSLYPAAVVAMAPPARPPVPPSESDKRSLAPAPRLVSGHTFSMNVTSPPPYMTQLEDGPEPVGSALVAVTTAQQGKR